MNVLVTGAYGQLGQSVEKLSSDYPLMNFVYTDQNNLDITNSDAVISMIRDQAIDCIINCAAYTAVDKAEQESDLAFLVNETGPAMLAKACSETNCYLIHISTDYVFSGKGFRPYPVSAPIDPESVYAKSKAAGEIAIMNSKIKGVIIRTSWLYSEFGNNFVKTMLRLSKERNELKVIADQVGSPTYAVDLASGILSLIKKISSGEFVLNGVELFHYANLGCASWFDFTKAIIQMSEATCDVFPIQTEEYPLPAPRPFYSVLDTSKIRTELSLAIPYWRDSLKKCIDILLTH